MIRLDNKQKKPFILTANASHPIYFYLCGPTVYGDVHIGNLRGSFLFDLLARLCKFHNIPYFYYQNITDIDQKIIDVAKTKKQPPLFVSNFYYEKYLEIFQKCQLLLPQFVKVSDYIEKIHQIIQILIEKKLAYQTSSGVYFDSLKNSYQPPQLSQSLKITLARNPQKDKKNLLDFVLWKVDSNQFGWNSPWGKGLPGWHTECVALLDNLTNANSTIHGGGTELFFPHHWNEQAQLKALYPQSDFVNFWLYNGLVSFKTIKLSRSSEQTSRVFLVKNFLQKYSINFLRFFFFLTPYNKVINLYDDYFSYVQNWENKILTMFKNLQYHFFLGQQKFFFQEGKIMKNHFKDFLDTVSNNLNVVVALDLVGQWNKDVNLLLKKKNYQEAANLAKTVWKALTLLGFVYSLKDYSLAIKKQLLIWKELWMKKDFVAADKIRQILQKKKIF